MSFDQTTYTADYNKTNYDRIELKIPKGKKAEWKDRAKAEGMNLTEWICSKVEDDTANKIYCIVDNDGIVYENDIKGKSVAEFVLKRTISEFRYCGEAVPEGLKILESEA